MLNYELAIKIKELRLSKSWSQQQLADISGLSLRTIQRIEKDGKCSHESLLTLASIFEVDVESFTKMHSKNNSKLVEFINKFLLFNFFQGFSPKTIAFLSILLISPSLYFITANILYYYLDISFLNDSLQIFYENKTTFKIFNLMTPMIFIGGTLLAVYFNLATLIKFNLKQAKNKLVGTLTYSPNLANIIVLCLAIILIMIFFTYVMAENFGRI